MRAVIERKMRKEGLFEVNIIVTNVNHNSLRSLSNFKVNRLKRISNILSKI